MKTENSAKGHPGLKPADYLVQLDGVRALAVLSVMYWHWMSNDQMNFPFGGGVQLFFVLSGFLITGILIRCRDRAPDVRHKFTALKMFVVRRVLRIFPLYYAVLIAAAVVGMWPVRESIWWHLGYLTNFYFYKVGEYQGVLTHFWSLAIEEQFYLFWPWLVLFLKPKHLPRVIIGLIAFSVCWRFYGSLSGNVPLYEVVTWANFDALGLGALLAAVRGNPAQAKIVRRIGLFAIIPLVVSQVIVYAGINHPLNMAIRHESLVFACVWAVAASARGFSGWAGTFLSWSPMVYLGKISYGLYVFHYFAGPAVHAVGKRLFPGAIGHEIVRISLMLAFTIGISALSWRIMEKPLNDMKSRYPYPS